MEHFKNVIISPRYSLRLEDLTPEHVFQARCLRCNRTKIIDPAALLSTPD